MIHDDLIKLYPALVNDCQIRIVELMDHVLSTYDRKISLYTADQFKRAGECQARPGQVRPGEMMSRADDGKGHGCDIGGD